MRKQILIFFALLIHGIWIQAQTVYEVSDFAGSGVYGSSNGSGTAASLNNPYGLCMDATGNVYVADYSNHKIRKITPTGVVSDVAGSGNRGSANGTGAAASFNNPSGICIDASGNLFVVDRNNNKIRKISPSGVVSDFAGSGHGGSANGTGTAASFNSPFGIIMDASGNFLVTDRYNNKIRKITAAGVVSDFAGSGSQGSANGAGSAASFNWPMRMVMDASGNLYVTDYSNHKIRKITPAGVVSDFAGSGQSGSANGTGSSASFHAPAGICIDASSNLYVAEYRGNKIRKITPAGEVSDFAGSGNKSSENGIGTSASFNGPLDIAIDASGSFFYVADMFNHKIRKITVKAPAAPVVNYVDFPASVCLGSTLNKTPTVTGSEVKINLEQNTIATKPIKDIQKGTGGCFFVLYNGDSIVKYNSLGVRIMRYDENATLSNIRAIAVDSSNRVYTWSDGVNYNAIHRIGNNGWVDLTFNTPAYSFTNVTDMKVGFDNFLYVADDVNGYISKVDPSNAYMSTFATMQGVSSISFGKTNMYIFKASLQKAYASSLSSANFTEVFQGLSDLNMNFDEFEYDTSGLVGYESFFVSSKIQNKVYRFANYGNGFDISAGTAIDYSSLLPINQPLAITQIFNSGTESVWVATDNDTLINVFVYAYKVTPALPAGLSFDILKGTIKGTPITSAPATTYTIEVSSDVFGIQTYTINFSIDVTGSINNSVGTTNASNDQADGLKINYFDINNCAEIMAIEDENGGTVIGNVEVKQDVLPTLASFASGSFVRRVTEINAQNNEAEARIKLYFTYGDINHYNSTNGPSDPDLVNDTTLGTMQVAILQLHKSDNGVTEQIKHFVTANWNTAKSLWIADFQITKFSTFYLGEASYISGFDCSSNGSTTTVSSCGVYSWRDKSYSQSGIYKDTISNQFGCDSILTLDLTVTNDFEITQDEFFPEYLYCNTTGADSYQWINCDNGGTILVGDTSDSFVATYNGSYAVIVTNNGCTDTSLCITVTGLAAQPSSIDVYKGNVLELVSVFPNPSNGMYRIESVDNYMIIVRSLLGEIILHEKVSGKIKDIDLSAYPSGIYYLTIQTDLSSKTVKLVKNSNKKF